VSVSDEPYAVEKLRVCPVCDAANFSEILTHPDGFIPLMHIHRCAECQTAFLNPRLTVAALLQIEKDSEVYAFPPDVAEDQVRARDGIVASFERYTGGPGRLLELGCNRGLLMEAARRRGWNVAGVELSEEAANSARRDYGLRVFPTIEAVDPERFDLVVAWHVLEHTREPVTFLATAKARLRPGGVMALQVPSFHFVEEYRRRGQITSLLCAAHNFHFTRATLTTLLERANLTVLDLNEDPSSLFLTAFCTSEVSWGPVRFPPLLRPVSRTYRRVRLKASLKHAGLRILVGLGLAEHSPPGAPSVIDRAMAVYRREGVVGLLRRAARARKRIAGRHSDLRTVSGRPQNTAPSGSGTSETTSLVSEDEARRKALGDAHIGGRGIEIGAGVRPSQYANVQELTVVDKRTPEELEVLFKARIPYRVLTPDQAFERARVDPADFVVAHHVLEHTPNPILTVVDWLSLLRPGGRLFISVPAHDNPCEKDRLRTPIDHLLDDYLFQRDGTDYESKDHILSFIVQWTNLSLDTFHYAQKGVKYFVETSLSELARDGHDLHWHTFTPEPLRQVIQAAFWFAGFEAQWLCHEHSGGCIYTIVSKGACADPRSRPVPDCISRHRTRLESALKRLVGPAGDV